MIYDIPTLIKEAEERRWIPISERMPTKEERENNNIAWWNLGECQSFIGEYRHYDGKWITVSARGWHIDMPFSEFTHWTIIGSVADELALKSNENLSERADQ